MSSRPRPLAHRIAAFAAAGLFSLGVLGVELRGTLAHLVRGQLETREVSIAGVDPDESAAVAERAEARAEAAAEVARARAEASAARTEASIARAQARAARRRVAMPAMPGASAHVELPALPARLQIERVKASVQAAAKAAKAARSDDGALTTAMLIVIDSTRGPDERLLLHVIAPNVFGAARSPFVTDGITIRAGG